MAPGTAFRFALSTLALLACGRSVFAQALEVELDPRMPFALERVIDVAVDAPGVVILTGDTAIGEGRTLSGPLVHFGGALVLEGAVEGDVTAVASEVYLRPTARIAGNLTIVGGRYYGTTMADVRGSTTWMRQEPVTVTVASSRVTVDYEPPPGPGFPIEPRGLAGVVIHGYNGVDGLSFGLEAGLVRRRDWPRTELSGGPVFRTERDDVGWRVAGLRELPRAGGIVVGADAYRLTTSPEAWHRGNLGNSLAALVFADDDRTYHERTGYELWVEKAFPLAALTVRGTWRDDDFESLPSRTPFALFGDDEDWRVNPPIEEGSGRALGARLTWDRRDDPSFPTRGAWAEGRLEHWGFGSDFGFDWAQGQVRLYRPLATSRGSFVALRAMGGGPAGRRRYAGAPVPLPAGRRQLGPRLRCLERAPHGRPDVVRHRDRAPGRGRRVHASVPGRPRVGGRRVARGRGRGVELGVRGRRGDPRPGPVRGSLRRVRRGGGGVADLYPHQALVLIRRATVPG
jgi:hypothetical protein